MYSILAYWSCFVIAFIKHGNTLQMDFQASPKKTWDQAYLECQQKGMELAILNSQADYEAAVSYIDASINIVWIGLKIKNVQNKIFEWINGEDLLYTPWITFPSNPNYFECDSCVRLYRLYSGDVRLGDTACSDEFAFLCTEIKAEKFNSSVPGDCSLSDDELTIATAAQSTSDVNYTYPKNGVTNETISCPSCNCSGDVNWEQYKNYTFAELKVALEPRTTQLRKELLVDRTTLSSYTNKFISKNDPRPSATTFGVFGLLFLIFISSVVILADLMTLFK